MNKPLRIGLTGGIGSGKTTVAQIFEVLGVPVFYADAIAKQIMNTDEDLKEKLVAAFGEETYINNILNRKYIASVVFANVEQLEQLNAIVHPATIAAAERWFAIQKSPYVIKEAALLFEAGTATGLDYVIGVSSPQFMRVERVIERDKIDAENVLKRINKQMDEQTKMDLCDFVLVNDDDHLLIPQVLKIHEQLCALTNAPE